jgi:prepilin-type N-terminal cleavage/methylation domain-containing protein
MILSTVSVNSKKAFSLLELVMVIVLIGVVTSIMLPNLFKTNTKKEIELASLKTYLVSNYTFTKNISFTCIKKDLLCYVFVDGVRNENVTKDIFTDDFEVYSSVDPYNRMEFERVYINEFDEVDVAFNLTINKDFKSNEFLLSYDNKIYHYNSIKNKASIYEDLGEYRDYVEFKKAEIKHDI